MTDLDSPAAEPTRPDPSLLDTDLEYRAAVIDLIAVLAYSELVAYERLAADGALAPTIADKAAIGAMAAAEYRHFVMLSEWLRAHGVDPDEAMKPFRGAIDEFHAHTSPSDWLEGLVKAYVGDGIALDFYRQIAKFVDAETYEVVLSVCEDFGQSEFIVEKVRAAVVADPKVGGRLALWGRRLVGEALSQAQRVAAERDALASFIVGGVDRPGADLAEIGRMFASLTEHHTRRMSALGLAA